MRISSASQAGDGTKPTEDWFSASDGLIVVLDGSTARTDTGCVHGVAWFSAKLGSATVSLAAEPTRTLPDACRTAITQVAAMHPQCDLEHPGTPSAFIAIVRVNGGSLEYLVLGDPTIAIRDANGQVTTICDSSVEATARAARDQADRHPIGSTEKRVALLAMKHAELAARNTPGGYWVASTAPDAIDHAIVGQVPLHDVRDIAVLTDGAARIADLFQLLDWPQLMTTLATYGPDEIIRGVRAAEDADPEGIRWPRNKRSDDATAVYMAFGDRTPTTGDKAVDVRATSPTQRHNSNQLSLNQ